MVQIVLIRAGETEYDQQGRIQGTLNIPLSTGGEEGVAQIIEDLQPLEIDALYCACGTSAVQTADIIAGRLGMKTRKLDALHNVNHGLWQGMLVDEVKRKHPRVFRQWQEEPESICPPEGELLGSARQRVAQGLKKLLRKHKQGRIAIVAPEPLASLIVCQLTNRELAQVWPAVNGHATWELIKLEPQDTVTS